MTHAEARILLTKAETRPLPAKDRRSLGYIRWLLDNHPGRPLSPENAKALEALAK